MCGVRRWRPLDPIAVEVIEVLEVIGGNSFINAMFEKQRRIVEFR